MGHDIVNLIIALLGFGGLVFLSILLAQFIEKASRKRIIDWISQQFDNGIVSYNNKAMFRLFIVVQITTLVFAIGYTVFNRRWDILFDFHYIIRENPFSYTQYIFSKDCFLESSSWRSHAFANTMVSIMFLVFPVTKSIDWIFFNKKQDGILAQVYESEISVQEQVAVDENINTEFTQFCTQCGQSVYLNDKFCKNCGKALMHTSDDVTNTKRDEELIKESSEKYARKHEEG